MTTFAVTNLNDSGSGSLRAVIMAANADTSGTPTIVNFSVAGTITLSSALPTISHSITIDATTAPTYNLGGPPVVAIDFNQNAGLVFGAGSDSSSLLGVAIDNASGNGVTLDASGITLNDNYIGLGLAGQAAGNSGDGVYVSAASSGNQIGVNPTSAQGTAAAAGVVANVISANGGNGISLHGSSGNTIVANRIGTDPTGTSALANGGNGIWVTGGSINNMIGGSAYIDSTTGKANDPTGAKGTTAQTLVTPPLGNLISGNGQNGVLIDTGSQNNQLSGNFIGTTADGNNALGNGGDGVWINGANNNSLIGTPLINPPGSPNAGTYNQTPFTYYNVVSGNGGNGLQVTNSNHVTVQANFLGAAANDAGPVANALNGILVDGSSQDTVVGGVIPLGNVVSGNTLNGIDVAGTASGFESVNTFAGLLAFGPAAANGNDGILITSDDSSGAGPNGLQTNVVSGNSNNGIELAGNASGVEIEPNIVGLTTAGNAPLPNGGDGLLITGTAHENTVGGSAPLPPVPGLSLVSVIPNQAFSANGGYGIAISGQAYDNSIAPVNFVGLDVIGDNTMGLGNQAGGILIGGSAHDNTIGGTGGTPNRLGTDSNVIAGNSGPGITNSSSGANNVISNNIVGFDQFGAQLPNSLPLSEDLNSDGVSDLLMTNTGTGALVFDEVSAAGQMTYTQIGGLGPEWQFEGSGAFLGDGNQGELIYDSSNGTIAIAENSGGTAQYTAIGGLGSEWQFAGNGALLGQSTDDFLLWDGDSTSANYGSLVVGSVVGGTAQYAAIGGVGPNWQFKGVGDYLGDGRSGFLMEDSNTGNLEIGEDVSGSAQYTLVGGLGSEWTFEGSGNLLGTGQTDFLIWAGNSSLGDYGSLVVGQINGGSAQYTQIGAVGPEWQFLGVGNYDGASDSEFLMRNGSTGDLVVGAVSAQKGIYGVTYTQVGGVGPEWNFHTTNLATVP